MTPLPMALALTLLLGGVGELPGQSDPDSIPGTEAVLQPGAVVIVGELHGSREIPRLFGDLVASAARKAPVLVALEIDRRERARVAGFLGSLGSTQDRTALLSGDFWTDAYQDGRRSEAVLELLDGLRSLRESGRTVDVVLVDSTGFSSPQERDAYMARRLSTAAADRLGSITLALTGNFHSRIRPGLPWDPSFEPMALLVRRELRTRRVLGLDSRYPSGTAWICSGSGDGGCGARGVQGLAEPSAEPAVVLAPELERYDGYIVVDGLTASPPAKDLR